MGESSTYVCNKCGYAVLTCAGGAAGMRVVKESHVCPRCRIITDAIVVQVREVKRNGKDEMESVEIAFPRCERCGSRKITRWDTVTRPCPKCGGTMQKGDGLVCEWD